MWYWGRAGLLGMALPGVELRMKRAAISTACRLPSQQISTVSDCHFLALVQDFIDSFVVTPKIFFSQLAFSSGKAGWEEEAELAFGNRRCQCPWPGVSRGRGPHVASPYPRAKENQAGGGVCPVELRTPQISLLSALPVDM